MWGDSVLYTPVFNCECRWCGTDPCVGIPANPESEDSGIRSTGMCGPCFFQDRTMIDWEDWNTPKESTE